MSPFPQNIDPRIWTLANAVCEGTISEQEVHELELLLDADPNAREFYIDFLKINAEISWLISSKQHSTMDLGPRISLDSLLGPPNPSPNLGFLGNVADFFNHHSPLLFVMLFLIFGVTLLSATYWLNTRQSGKTSIEPEFVAQITVTKDCQWSTSITQPTEMMQLQVGQQLQLEKGIAQITYSNGAVVLIEGPAFFAVASPNSGFLSRGKLTARADTKQSRQFAIVTPEARFVDLGTEFGVMIDDKGRAAVAVFAGKVNAEAKLADGRWSTPVSLSKGEAGICEGTNFTRQVASRSDFPALRLPPPPPSLSFQRWLDVSHDLQSRQDLVAYYDFQPDPSNPTVLFNRAPTGSALNGEIQNATWVEGRFPGKSALEFSAGDAGVRVNLPGEYRQMTLIAWLSSKRLANSFNGILMSDGWMRTRELHWEIRDGGQVDLIVFGQKVHRYSDRAIPADSLNRWCMVTGVIDTATNQTFTYVNGEYVDKFEPKLMPAIQIGSATIGGWDNQGKGDSSSGKTHNLSGRMDELMIFQTALTAEEIKRFYEAGKP
jgi:hypothetical protein